MLLCAPCRSLYQRFVMTLPYIIAAPKLFEENTVVTLGDLQMLRGVFFDVFFALNAFAVHWPEINELRATVRRLNEFERILEASEASAKSGQPLPASGPKSHVHGHPLL